MTSLSSSNVSFETSLSSEKELDCFVVGGAARELPLLLLLLDSGVTSSGAEFVEFVEFVEFAEFVDAIALSTKDVASFDVSPLTVLSRFAASEEAGGSLVG